MTISAQIDPKYLSTDTLDIRTKNLFVLPKDLRLNKNDSLLNKTKIQAKDVLETPDSLATSKFNYPADSLSISTGSFYPTQQDGVKKREFVTKLKRLVPHGNVSVGYDYGFLPYTVNMPSPASAFNTEGRLEMNVLAIPLDVVFFYTSQKNLVGLNNYFRISYSPERYKEKLNSKVYRDIDSQKNKLGQLNTRRQETMQKMAYADYLSSVSPDKWPVQGNPTKLTAGGSDTSGMLSGMSVPDTSGITQSVRDSLQNTGYYSKADSLRREASVYKNRKDSVTELYERYRSTYDLLNDSIGAVKNKISELESLVNQRSPYAEKSPYLSKVQNFLSGVKKLDVGLCYPAYSTFLTNNVPVRGVNFEYQKNNYFFAFTYGTTVSTLLYSNRTIDGFLQNVRNSYNYFDVNDLSAGRKILSTKFGIGEKDGDHFFAGFLVGKGASTYFVPSPETSAAPSIQSNLVFEADVRKKLSKLTVLDIVVGKSSVQEADLNMNTLRTAAKEVFSNYRSYAALIKLGTGIAATKSALTFSVRWVDPFYTSYGIGFMRSDNMRYEAKLDQPLGKRLRYTLAFRYEEDNLLRLLNYKNKFYSVNNTVAYKIRRGLTLRVSYTPLVRTLRGENYHFKNKNSIVTGILTFAPRSKRVQKQFSLLYNSYNITTDSTPIRFQNFAYYQQLSFRKGFSTWLNISWFKNSLQDSSGDDVFLAVLDAGYKFKNGSSFSVAGKSAYKKSGELYPGFVIRSTFKLADALFWENQVEKFIVGDLFNGYDLELLRKFPYCFTTKLVLNF